MCLSLLGGGGGEGDNAVHNYPRTSKISDLLCVVAPSSTVPHRNSPACCVYLWGSLSHALLAFVSPSPTCLGFFTPSPPRSGNGWRTNIAYLQKALNYIAIVDCYRSGAVPKLYPCSEELPFDSACGVRRQSSALSLRSQHRAGRTTATPQSQQPPRQRSFLFLFHYPYIIPI